MKINKKNLGVGCFVTTKLARKNVSKVLESGRLSYGPFIKKFERKFAKAHGVKSAVMVNSGTSALRIAVACLKECHKWRDGDEVLIPSVTFIATANVVLSNGLKPVFVDVDSKTYNIDPVEIEKKITKKTKAMIPVHLMGQPAEMEAIMQIAKKYRLKVIEDSCETMFTRYRGKSVGSFGDISCFSTYIAHLINTGVGGLALTSNPKYAEILRSLANHGRDNIYISIDDDKKVGGRLFSEIIKRRFRFIRPGYSFRVTEFEGALGCAEMMIVRKMINKRQQNTNYLIKKLDRYNDYIQLPWHPEYTEHACMLFPVVLKNGSKIRKDKFVQFLEKKGIETRDLMPLINQPYILKLFKHKVTDFPVANWINKNGFYIGCHQKMRKVELDYIVKCFNDFFGKYEN